jgi:hypothetical protein
VRTVVLACVVAAALIPGTRAHASLPPSCAGAALTGSFTAVPGSAGAGNIVYALRVRNVSKHLCTVTGLPQVRLLDTHRKGLPTHVTAAHPGMLTAVLVRLKPGAWASAPARFSPDVPGPGEPAAGKNCERTAVWLRVVAPGGGSAVVPVKPATPVCEHGALSFSGYGVGKTPPQ